ncbi:MAG TPA: SpoIIE family protein phosphatase [Acidimicrobiales bacterium]|nr:SpoIIE family protein phosphatase [Acidimicrobiales bacterium]
MSADAAELTGEVRLERLARTALEHVCDGVLLVDAEWQIVYANGNAASITHVPVADLVGQSLWAVFPHANRSHVGDRYRNAMRNQEIQEVEGYHGAQHGWLAVRALPAPTLLTLCFQSIDARRAAAASQSALVATLEQTLTRQQLTQSVIVALAETSTVAAVATAVLQLATETLDTALAGVALLVDDDRALRFISLVAPDGNPVEVLPSAPLRDHSALADCVRRRQPLYHGTRDEMLGAYPDQNAVLAASPSEAFANLPLAVRGRAIGALSLSWTTERVFTQHDRDFMFMLAAQCAQAIERTQLLSRQRDVAETLQQAMLPDVMPAVEGVEVSACYLPATSDLTVGGDWYDAFLLDDGRVALAVGDVSGHGVQAAAVMGQVRNSLRAYLLEGHGPALALTKLDALVERAEHGLFATAIVAIYSPHTGSLVWANAGHPPLVLRTPTGTRLLEGPVAAPIGVRGPDPHVDQRLLLEVGDVVVGYTDGLIERRREDLGVSLHRLVQAVHRAPVPATGSPWCVDLVDTMLGQRPRADDICVLVARRV